MRLHLPTAMASALVAGTLLAGAPPADAAPKRKPPATKHVKAKHAAAKHNKAGAIKLSRAKPGMAQPGTRSATAVAGAAGSLSLPPQTITGTRPPPGLDDWLGPGDHRFTIQHEGLARSYLVHVPPRYKPTETAPMLVALNSYAGAQAQDDGFDSLRRQSDHQGYIAVYPDAYGAEGRQPAWTRGDVRFIEKVVNNVFRQTTVDRARIYAAGASDGGTMAYQLACALPDVFRGVASVGGNDTSSNCPEGKAVTVFHIHAQDDKQVPFSQAPLIAAKWAQRNGCELAPRKVLQYGKTYCEAYTYCRSRTAVELCATETGGQSWPGARPKAGAGSVPSQAIDGAGSMWAFLRGH